MAWWACEEITTDTSAPVREVHVQPALYPSANHQPHTHTHKQCQPLNQILEAIELTSETELRLKMGRHSRKGTVRDVILLTA